VSYAIPKKGRERERAYDVTTRLLGKREREREKERERDWKRSSIMKIV
jgi:hypothetical protein